MPKYCGSRLHKLSVSSLSPSNPWLLKFRNVPAPIPLGFCISLNQNARDISAPWNPQLSKCRNAEMLKCQSALVFDQRLMIIPRIYDPRPTSLFLYFMIQGFERQGYFPFQLPVPEIAKSTHGPDLFENDGHYSS
jgi:hypothetical protein